MKCSLGRCIIALDELCFPTPRNSHHIVRVNWVSRRFNSSFSRGNGVWCNGFNSLNLNTNSSRAIRRFEQSKACGGNVSWPRSPRQGFVLTPINEYFIGTESPLDHKTPSLQTMDDKIDGNDFKDQSNETTDEKVDGSGFKVQSNEVLMLREIEASLGSPLDSGPQVPPPKPLIIVISGPSGVGKDAVIKKLQEVRKGIHFVVTATTRAKRPGEVDGKDYFFVSKEEFLSMIDNNELLEHALVYGDYKGIPKQQIRDFMSKGYDIVLRVDVQGAATLKSILGDSALFVFLAAESEVSLAKRLMGRKTETMEKLVVRISTAREEVKHITEFDYAVVNAEGWLERTVSLVVSIIDAEKAKVQQRVVEI